jgi:hypothetical protein
MGTSTLVAYAVLASDTEVYRAYPFPDSYNRKTGKVEPKLFYRKQAEEALSVGLSKQAILELYSNASGMCSLVIGAVRESPDPLDVVQDTPLHASITGVPLRSEDQERALRIAKYLSRIATHSPADA